MLRKNFTLCKNKKLGCSEAQLEKRETTLSALGKRGERETHIESERETETETEARQTHYYFNGIS